MSPSVCRSNQTDSLSDVEGKKVFGFVYKKSSPLIILYGTIRVVCVCILLDCLLALPF
jgi:hypothetical protein